MAASFGAAGFLMSGDLISRAKTVAFQGEPGAYAHLAAREALPHAEAVPRPTFDDAVNAVRNGETDLCIMPVENSLMGRIADTSGVTSSIASTCTSIDTACVAGASCSCHCVLSVS